MTLESGGAARWHSDISGHDSEDDSDFSSSVVSDSSCDLVLDEAGFHICGFYDWVLERDLGFFASELLQVFLECGLSDVADAPSIPDEKLACVF